MGTNFFIIKEALNGNMNSLVTMKEQFLAFKNSLDDTLINVEQNRLCKEQIDEMMLLIDRAIIANNENKWGLQDDKIS